MVSSPGVKHHDMVFLETTVPPTETNYYCMTFDLPADQDYHVIATEPIMDNMEVLHHILVYACEDGKFQVFRTLTSFLFLDIFLLAAFDGLTRRFDGIFY